MYSWFSLILEIVSKDDVAKGRSLLNKILNTQVYVDRLNQLCHSLVPVIPSAIYWSKSVFQMYDQPLEIVTKTKFLACDFIRCLRKVLSVHFFETATPYHIGKLLRFKEARLLLGKLTNGMLQYLGRLDNPKKRRRFWSWLRYHITICRKLKPYVGKFWSTDDYRIYMETVSLIANAPVPTQNQPRLEKTTRLQGRLRELARNERPLSLQTMCQITVEQAVQVGQVCRLGLPKKE